MEAAIFPLERSGGPCYEAAMHHRHRMARVLMGLALIGSIPGEGVGQTTNWMSLYLPSQMVGGSERSVFSRDDFTVADVVCILRDMLARTNQDAIISRFGGHPSYKPSMSQDAGLSNDIDYLLGPFQLTNAPAVTNNVGWKSFVDQYGNYTSTVQPGSYPPLDVSATSVLAFYAGRFTAAAGITEWLTNIELAVNGTLYCIRAEDDTPVPPAPSYLTASQGSTSGFIRVTWSNSAFAEAYLLWRALSSTGGVVPVGGTVVTNQYDDASVVSNQIYYYWVAATNIVGCSPTSGPAQGWLILFTNPVPFNISNMMPIPGAMLLQWEPSSADAFYTVERSASLTAPDWTPGMPTGQWPIVATSWTASTAQAAAFLRVYAMAPGDVAWQTNFITFDEMPVTTGLSNPDSGPPWLYTTASENPLPGIYMTENDCAGWRNTNLFGPQTNLLTFFYLYLNSYDSDHMGYATYGYLEIDDGNAVSCHSLRFTITGGVDINGTNGIPITTKAHYTNLLVQGSNPVAEQVKIGQPYLYFANNGEKYAPVAWPEARRANRMSSYYYAPATLTNYDGLARPYPNANFGPYNAVEGHWYHEFCTRGGGWTHAVCDGHPQHNNSWSSATNYPFPSRSLRNMGTAYFTNWYRFYLMFKPPSGIGFAPYDVWVDEISFLYDPEPQNEETIASMSVTYYPTSQTFEIGFMDKYKDNGHSYSTYELRYSFQPIDNQNWADATPASILTNATFKIHARADGKFQKPSPYYQSVWAPFELAGAGDTALLTAGSVIHFAVKDISQIGGDGMLPVTNSGIGPFAIDGRDYSTYGTNFDYAGDQPALPLIKRIDYRIPETLSNACFHFLFSPTNMPAAGARWRIDGGAWNAKSAQWMPPGIHTAEWSAVSGWTTPSAVVSTAQPLQSIILTGLYQP